MKKMRKEAKSRKIENLSGLDVRSKSELIPKSVTRLYVRTKELTSTKVEQSRTIDLRGVMEEDVHAVSQRPT